MLRVLRALRSSRRLPVLGLLIGIACVGALPATALAGTSVTPPAAVRFTLNIQTTGFGSGVNGSLSGVANQNGDTQATVTFGDHKYGFIMAGGVAYQNEDGGPYQIATPSPGPTSAAGAPGGPACAGGQAGLNPLVQQALTGQNLWTALGIQDLGPATIGGLQAEHYQGTVDLSRALTDPEFMQALSALLNACGGDTQAASAVPLLLAASKMSADAYVDPSTAVPLQFDLNVSVPILSASLDLSGQMTPLSSPVPIAAPS